MSFYSRREFPNDPLPAIVHKNGAVSLSALKTHFSARGCPNADPNVARALIKSGLEPFMAIQVAMFAHYYGDKHGPAVECMERTAAGMVTAARSIHARMHPWGFYAEERAARLEGRPSRWGTPEMHTNATVRTKHFPHEDSRKGGA